MQRLAQVLPASAVRLSRLSPACPSPSLCVLSRLSLSPPKFNVWQRNARLLFSTSVRSQSPHSLYDTIEEIADKQEAQTPLNQGNQAIWEQRSKDALSSAKSRPPADAYSGRTVWNPNDRLFARSLRELDAILSRNKVRQQLRLTQRHEKKGVKRRRLSSERWRKRFADEVRKKVKLVMKIRNRGA